jgi:hypothetical protein
MILSRLALKIVVMSGEKVLGEYIKCAKKWGGVSQTSVPPSWLQFLIDTQLDCNITDPSSPSPL